MIQAVALAALILVPIFGRTERLVSAREYVPLPPFPKVGAVRGRTPPVPGPTTGSRDHIFFNSIPTETHPRTDGDWGDSDSQNIFDDPNGSAAPGPIGPPGGTGPAPPPEDVAAKKPRTIHPTHIDPALLTYRVEPVYPPLARQLHREGRVELHALISTDGTIRSLEAVSGDPLFYGSATNAVSQWRYRPLFLNGQAVEIDTYITVIYTVGH